ncbi:MAG TPA: hypothetical protein VGQ75_09670 [Thermoanaerobaculia bacterium]|jgi:hypothetical protein|nr:hypothetical protein [Thermoanaerobaculia bacterium]HEV8609134.1 hypothetical protein [Thermoanaerobaculia bacterium]
MKKTVKARYAGFLALALACCGWLATASVAQAQVQGRYRRNTVSNASYERMRQWARELDELAEHANEQAQADQAGYRGFRRDTNFLKSIDHFARRAREFRSKMDSYRTRPWNVDDEIEHLLRDAREVQKRLRRARFADSHTREDWNQVVDLLNRTLNEYRTSGRYRDGRGRYGDGRYRGSPDTRGNNYPDTRSNDGYYDPNGPSRYSTDLRQLAQELDERAARVAQMTNRYGSRYGSSSELRRFSDEARNFRVAVEGRQFSQTELRSRINRLLQEAQSAHDEISRSRVSSDVAAEWDGIVRVLDRMRDLVV